MGEEKQRLTGVWFIAEERHRQKAEKGFDDAHDDEHKWGELAWAAACYAAPGEIAHKTKDADFRPCYVDPWPWDRKWDKRDKHDYKRRLIIAGAWIAAEIDRLIRLEERD